MQIKVVVHFLDHRLVKGTTVDFTAVRESFHVIPVPDSPDQKPLEVRLSDIKAVFFVKDFTGNPDYEEKKDWIRDAQKYGRPIIVRFKDGEEMRGYTQTYSPGRRGFFVLPCDPNSNNTRVFVVASSVTELVLPHLAATGNPAGEDGTAEPGSLEAKGKLDAPAASGKP